MTTSVTTRIKKTKTVVPVNITQANSLLAEIGKKQNVINEIEADLQIQISALRSAAAKKLLPLLMERDTQTNALFAFASPRKEELTKEIRTVSLASGSFGWRMTTPRVVLSQNDKEAVAFLKGGNNDAYVRTVEEVDRQKLLAEKPEIDGISYMQNDEFFVVPKQKAKKPETITRPIDRI